MRGNQPIIWVLADDRAGNVSQAIGAAEALEMPYQIKDINYTKMASLPNIIRGASLLGLDKQNSSELIAPWPDLVIAAGRKTAPIARYIKKQSGGKVKLVQIMWPGFPSGDFDLIVTPAHDQIENKPNLMRTVGAINKINEKTLAIARKQWQEKFAEIPRPLIAVLIGGDTKKGVFTKKHAKDLLESIKGFEGGLLVTTSRRTNNEVREFIQTNISTANFYSPDSGGENPYMGYLACADIIIASGDSISMCSEAASTGKPVYIFAPKDITPKKHQSFHKALYKNGHAAPLTEACKPYSPRPLAEAQEVAMEIKKLLSNSLTDKRKI